MDGERIAGPLALSFFLWLLGLAYAAAVLLLKDDPPEKVKKSIHLRAVGGWLVVVAVIGWVLATRG